MRLKGAVDGGPEDFEQLGEVADCVVVGAVHPAQFLLLFGSELGLAAFESALGAGDGHPFPRSEPEQVDFEFREGGPGC